MCTLIVGVDVAGPTTLVMAANRDEDPNRPSLTPGLLSDQPRVVGGRDAVAGGTWLALRGREAVVALLNRRPRGGHGTLPTRSRGLLALDVARVPGSGDGQSQQAFERLEALVSGATYAPFSLAWLAGRGSWIATQEPGAALSRRALEAGWHVLTHEDLDDASEPRTRRLLALLDRFQASTPPAAEERLIELLAIHEHPVEGESGEQPPVCLHAGRMMTVSAAVVSFAGDRVTYRHIEGRPCTESPRDYSHLLARPTAET